MMPATSTARQSAKATAQGLRPPLHEGGWISRCDHVETTGRNRDLDASRVTTRVPMMNAADPPIPSQSNERWTTRKLLRWMTEHFESREIDSPRMVAEMLLAHVLECERMRLYMEVDRPTSPEERSALRTLVGRATRHEPVQYLLGEAWFFGKPFIVDPSVLIPRPSTETLVEHVLQWLRRRDDLVTPLIADIGTGSGCVAVSIAMNHPGVRLIASDISQAALEMARRNAERHGVAERIDFRSGSLLAPIESDGETFDAICSNPPYIPDHEWSDVAMNVRDHEPHEALRGGEDGLDFVRPLLAGAGDRLKPGGQLVVEIAACQHETVTELTSRTGVYEDIRILTDHEHLNRVLVATRRS